MRRLSEHLHRFDDTCAVYVLRSGDEAALIDFGTGAVLDALAAIGVDRVTDVLMTHHHRDQGQGLPRAAELGIRILAPETERHLFDDLDHHWQTRTVVNSYDVREDRFSLLRSLRVDGVLRDHDVVRVGEHRLTVLPTPGHTVGSVTLLGEVDGRRCAFTGDLLHSEGRIWSLAATQWTYNGLEGVAATVASLLDLRDATPDRLLPSHGEPMEEPERAIAPLVDRLARLLAERGKNPRLFELRERPFLRLSDHLLMNRTAMAYHYVLLSRDRTAMFIDFGYDFVTGVPAGSDRASRRPSLATLATLKRDFAVERVEVALPTHYHDDHVAGLDLLRRVEGTEVWAAELIADVLERPEEHDLPCLWYEPIPVDRRLPLETPFRWREHELTLHHLPGHAHHAVAVAFEVDGTSVLAVGDQYQGGGEADPNYVYANGFGLGDYAASAALYRRLDPDLVLSGHWEPLRPDEAYHRTLEARGRVLDQLHHELLPPGRRAAGPFGAAGRAAWIRPYRIRTVPGGELAVNVVLRNLEPEERDFEVTLVVPPGFAVEPGPTSGRLPAGAETTVTFAVRAGPAAGRRCRLAADVRMDDVRLGQAAEALVTIEEVV